MPTGSIESGLFCLPGSCGMLRSTHAMQSVFDSFAYRFANMEIRFPKVLNVDFCEKECILQFTIDGIRLVFLDYGK